MNCDGCRYCCWAFGAPGMPVPDADGNPTTETYHKDGGDHCPYEYEKGCRIHEHALYPAACREFRCVYLEGMPIHSPDEFQAEIEAVMAVKGTVFPVIPQKAFHKDVRRVIRETGCIPDGVKGTPENPLQMLRDGDARLARLAWSEVLRG